MNDRFQPFTLRLIGFVACLCAVLGAPLSALAQAQQAPPRPFFKTSLPEPRRLVVESIYNYTRMQYDPVVIVRPGTRASASYATPEQAFMAQTSAMLAQDYDWWISGWTSAS